MNLGPKPPGVEALQQEAAKEVYVLDKEARFMLLHFLNGMFGLLWDYDKKSAQDFFLGHYGGYEGLADSGDKGRPSLVLTWVNESQHDEYQDGGSDSFNMVYTIIPISKYILDDPGNSHLPFVDEAFIVEVEKGDREDSIISYKQVDSSGLYDYSPTDLSLEGLKDFLENPELIRAIGNTRQDPTYVLGILDRLSHDMRPIEHTSLAPERRITAFTGGYFRGISS